ncbi:MAG: hypothetical protein JST66_10365 [Bacteroidetes bacterium]|nr:hypothetical protein [Bacteroidota bacterium]
MPLRLLVCLVVAALATARCTAQCLDSLGLDASPVLNPCEMRTLQHLGGTWPHLPAGTAPTVSFHQGNGARTVDKATFFERSVTPWVRQGKDPQLFWYLLTPRQREATGVDALVVAWSKKLLSKRRMDRIVAGLARDRRP